VTIAPTLDGVSSVDVVHTGKNLLPNKTYQRNPNILRLGTDTLDGRLSLKASTYTLSITSDVAIGTMTYTIGGTSTNIQFTSSGTRYYGSFTISADTDDFFVHVYRAGGLTAENVSDFMLEVGSSVSDYAPYVTPTTHTAQLGRTIYGGTADIVKGEGTSSYDKVDLGTLTWQYDSANTRFFTVGLTGVIKRGTSGWITDLEIDSPYTVASGTANDKTVSEYASTGYVYIKDTDYTDPTTFKASLSGKYLVYPLATSTDFTFDGQEVNTRLGVNNFWSDSGDTEVTYRADIDLLLGGN